MEALINPSLFQRQNRCKPTKGFAASQVMVANMLKLGRHALFNPKLFSFSTNVKAKQFKAHNIRED